MAKLYFSATTPSNACCCNNLTTCISVFRASPLHCRREKGACVSHGSLAQLRAYLSGRLLFYPVKFVDIGNAVGQYFFYTPLALRSKEETKTKLRFSATGDCPTDLFCILCQLICGT